MAWNKLTLTIPIELEESINELLTEAGAVSISLENAGSEPLFEPAPNSTPLWQHIKLSALFPVEINLIELTKSMPIQLIQSYSIETIGDQDWQLNFQQSFPPLCFSNLLWIYPSWSIPTQPQEPYLVLDPGLAFGTGTQPSTALCLEWLVQNLISDETVMDYGCGSGILALAAIKLGAKQVWAIDNDPQALAVTQENAQRNNISTLQLLTGSPSELNDVQTDNLIANILANTLIELAPTLTSLVKPGGNLVLSGILEHQIDLVINAYQPWFEFSTPVQQQEWVRLVAKKL